MCLGECINMLGGVYKCVWGECINVLGGSV